MDLNVKYKSVNPLKEKGKFGDSRVSQKCLALMEKPQSPKGIIDKIE